MKKKAEHTYYFSNACVEFYPHSLQTGIWDVEVTYANHIMVKAMYPMSKKRDEILRDLGFSEDKFVRYIYQQI